MIDREIKEQEHPQTADRQQRKADHDADDQGVFQLQQLGDTCLQRRDLQIVPAGGVQSAIQADGLLAVDPLQDIPAVRLPLPADLAEKQRDQGLKLLPADGQGRSLLIQQHAVPLPVKGQERVQIPVIVHIQHQCAAGGLIFGGCLKKQKGEVGADPDGIVRKGGAADGPHPEIGGQGAKQFRRVLIRVFVNGGADHVGICGVNGSGIPVIDLNGVYKIVAADIGIQLPQRIDLSHFV